MIHHVESCDTAPHLFCLSSDQTSSSNMKIDALNFLTVMLTHHSPHVLNPHIGTIIPVSHLSLSIHPSRSLCYSPSPSFLPLPILSALTLSSSSPSFPLHFPLPSQAVVVAVDDSFYKITSEALLVLHLIVKTIRSPGR